VDPMTIVPLDDPKPRVGQQRREDRPRPCCHCPFLYGSTLDFEGNSKPISKRDDVEALDAAAAGAATPYICLGRTRTHARPCHCAPPRPAVLHTSHCAGTYKYIPRRQIRRDLVTKHARSELLEEPEPWLGSNL
jgi:hypothetical protein